MVHLASCQGQSAMAVHCSNAEQVQRLWVWSCGSDQQGGLLTCLFFRLRAAGADLLAKALLGCICSAFDLIFLEAAIPSPFKYANLAMIC